MNRRAFAVVLYRQIARRAREIGMLGGILCDPASEDEDAEGRDTKRGCRFGVGVAPITNLQTTEWMTSTPEHEGRLWPCRHFFPSR
jgi:hypothetical protein